MIKKKRYILPLGDIIKFDNDADAPKYKQIVSSIIQAIEDKLLLKGQQIPSINQICEEFGLSRDTVLTAFNELKAKGIISAVPGKGYYVHTTRVNFERKIFLLFDELNAFKEELYNSFINAIGDKATVEIYFHYFNKSVFKSLLLDNVTKYTTYVVMPCQFKNILSTLEQVNGKVFILDQITAELKDEFPAVYQNFHKDVYSALTSGESQLEKYDKLIMVHPGGKEPIGQKTGFIAYCEDKQIAYEVIESLKDRTVQLKEAYIVMDDRDLVTLVKDIKSKGFVLGENVGIISYNDTSLKEVVANGITTISTNFTAMGESLAELILTNKTKSIENPSSLIIRGSL